MKSIDKKIKELKDRVRRLRELANTLLCISVLIIILISTTAGAEDFIQIPGVIHVHSTFSSGKYSIETLVSKAEEKGIGILILTDHDLVVMEYGIFPLRNIIKKRVEHNSVIKSGPDKYLEAINRINNDQDSVLVIPGVQSSPFYHWSGSPFSGDLIAHDYRKELLLIGMRNPEDYNNLPILYRGFSTNYITTNIPQIIIFFISLILGAYLFFQKGKFRYFGIGVGFLSLILLINHHPFQSSKFDPYHGDQGMAPFQELIDYVKSRNGLIFWAHPESDYAETGEKTGPITLQTKPYPDAMLKSKNYTGFSGLYGAWTTATDTGKHWDQALLEYCMKKRSHPVWIIAGADFHKDRSDGGAIDFDSYQTVFLMKKKGMQTVIDSLSSGKIYAVTKNEKGRLSLDRFQIGSKGSKIRANMGEKLNNPLLTEINIGISASDNGEYPIKIAIIRGGKVLKKLEGKTPYEIKLEDKDRWTGINYYRLEVDGFGKLLSNPIFVSMKGAKPKQSK